MTKSNFKTSLTFPVLCRLLCCDVLRQMDRSEWETVMLFWLQCLSCEVNESHLCSPPSAADADWNRCFILGRFWKWSLLHPLVFQWHLSPGLPQRHAPFQFQGRRWALLQTAWTDQPVHPEGKYRVCALGWRLSCELCLLCVAECWSVTEHRMGWVCCCEIIVWKRLWNSLFHRSSCTLLLCSSTCGAVLSTCLLFHESHQKINAYSSFLF